MSEPRDAHASGGRSQALLYDENVATPSHAERARTLVARVSTASLSTIALSPAGYPYGSFVTFAVAPKGAPLFLISDLAEHTRNLRADDRASLLVVERGRGDPLARGRVTLAGRCRIVPESERVEARKAFVASHPSAAGYAEFKDFSFWRLEVEAVRYIGGFGRMSWVDAEAWSRAEPDPLAARADGILAHMNADHADALAAYCRAFSRATDTRSATMTGVDRYGFEMSADTAEGPRPIRLAFSRPMSTADEVRKELVDLAKRARSTETAS